MWQRFSIDRRKIPLADLTTIDRFYWIVKYKKIRKKRNHSSLQSQGVLIKNSILLPKLLTDNRCRAINVFKKVLYFSNKNKLANIVCLLDSVFLYHSYVSNNNSPLHITPLIVNFCLKKIPNLLKNTIRFYSSSFHYFKIKDRTKLISNKKCLSILYRKVGTSQLSVNNIKKDQKKHFNNNIRHNIANMIIALKQFCPEKNGVYINITEKFLANPHFLMLAYDLIKSKEDTLTSKNTHKQTILTNLYKNWFTNAAFDIQNNLYEFKNNHKICVQKKNDNKKLKLLVIKNPRDKIIQKALRLILEEIYENKEKSFSKFSHGFHPNKGCYTALQQIKEEWTGIVWFIKIDIKNSFNSINHDFLISQLKLKIKDQRFTQTILKMFKANIISLLEVIEKKTSLPQDNILSPILINIYFQSLDLYIEKEIIEQYKKGIKPTKCPEYQNTIFLTTLKKRTSFQKKKQVLHKTNKKTYKSGLRYVENDNSFVRVKYIRYANSILIGVRSSKVFARKIFKIVSLFLKSNLQLFLDEEKSQILNSFFNKIPFLNMLLFKNTDKKILYHKSCKIEKRNHSTTLNQINTFNHKHATLFKNKFLTLLRKSYAKHKNNQAKIENNFNFLIKQSIIFKNLFKKPNFFIYPEFLKNLQKTTEIKKSKKLFNFLRVLEKKLSTSTSVSQKPLLHLLTKIKTITKIKNIFIEQYKITAYSKEWFNILKNLNKDEKEKWKIIRPKNFSLSQDTVLKLQILINKTCNTKKNLKNIYLTTKNLTNKIKILLKNKKLPIIRSKNIKKAWKKQNVFHKLPIQIKTDTDKIYNNLITNFIINNKKTPSSKISLIKSEAWAIIMYYNSLAQGFLSYFCYIDNFKTIKKIITYHIRYSLLRTLAHKHKCTSKKILATYSRKIITKYKNTKKISFINSVEISNRKKDFLITSIQDSSEKISKSFISLQKSTKLNHTYATIRFDETKNIKVHRSQKLHHNKKGYAFRQ